MIPKERVLTAFVRQEPDRVPINYLANLQHNSPTGNVIAMYETARKHGAY